MSLVQLRMASMCLEVGALPYIDTLGLHRWVGTYDACGVMRLGYRNKYLRLIVYEESEVFRCRCSFFIRIACEVYLLSRLRCESIDKRKKIITQKNCNRWIHCALKEVHSRFIAIRNAFKTNVNKTHHRIGTARSQWAKTCEDNCAQ